MMRSRDILTGFIVLVVLIGGALLIRNIRNRSQVVPTPTPSFEQKVKETFGGITIPTDGERAELKDLSGGGLFGIATEDMVLADLPDLDSGYFYQVWVEKEGTLYSLGKMRIAKGGFLFEGNVSGEKVIVSREKVFDNKIETRLLEGSF